MTTIHLSRAAPIILIDASYFTIHRLFATSRWWSMKNSTQEAGEEGFAEALIKHSEADIVKIQKKWGLIGRGNKAVAPNNIVFCYDCQPSSIWRIQVYDEYKRRYRTQPGDVCGLAIESNEALRDFHAHHKVAHPTLEADDVVCLLHRQVRAIMGEDQKIVIISSDHDFLQLKDEHCDIFCLPLKDIWPDGVKKGTADIHRKVLMGDPSDDIPAVLTKKQIDAYMALGEAEREAYLRRLGRYESYERNRKLMCWTCIPHDLAESFNRQWMIEG
jgi:5'-3' exonuclease